MAMREPERYHAKIRGAPRTTVRPAPAQHVGTISASSRAEYVEKYGQIEPSADDDDDAMSDDDDDD